MSCFFILFSYDSKIIANTFSVVLVRKLKLCVMDGVFYTAANKTFASGQIVKRISVVKMCAKAVFSLLKEYTRGMGIKSPQLVVESFKWVVKKNAMLVFFLLGQNLKSPTLKK